jgi:hypothetical protein
MIQTSGIRSTLVSILWWLVPWLIGYVAGVAVSNAFTQIRTVASFERFLLGLLVVLALEFTVFRAARRRFGQRTTDFAMWLIVAFLVGAAR